MQGLFRAMIAAFAALLGLGLFALTQSTSATADDVVAKRDDSSTVLLSHDDDDDDDDGDDDADETGASSPSGTGVSNDGTGSRVTAVSRDRDISNDDLTKDMTMDGGDLTRDFSQNHTNDASRNDTR
ncbi:MAG: hypothetical protein LH461_00005 [Spirochaetaceae bacterium]|nr:hypothetical protein [Spirochaetaceae bacterium]